MKNLKRVLAMGLATIMLCASMVTGSVASFNDTDKIVNTEAATITAGLGLFAGTTNGNFDPQGTVTRAQMAAVIAKMFYGSDLNADTYKGGYAFSDTVDFEGGWAEGYVNLGVEKGWFAGYGDGTFKPGQAVTTAEAVTMLINLLGINAGAGTWPMTVMATAEDIELFDLVCELKPAPATNAALTRDQLAVMVWNALNYSAEEVTGYKVIGSNITFTSWSDAASYADAAYGAGKWDTTYIATVREDTLADTVFELQTTTGYITDNQATTDNEYTTINGKNFAIETTLEDIGHFVTVYYAEDYKSERDPGVTYCIYDEAEYITIAEAIDSTRDYKKTLGTINVKGNVIVTNGNYVVAENATNHTYANGSDTAVIGTYVIYEDNMIGYIEPANTTVHKVTGVITTPGKESIALNGIPAIKNNNDVDNIVEYDGIAKNDIVLVKTVARGDETKYVVTKADKITGKVEKITNKDGDIYVTVNGNSYVAHENAGIADVLKKEINSENFDFNAVYDFYVCGDTYFGYTTSESTANMSDIIYVVDCYNTTTAGAYGTDVTKYFAQGVNMAGEEVNILIGAKGYGETSIEDGFYTFKKATERDLAKEDIMIAKAVETTGENYDILRGTINAAFDKDEMTVNANDEIYFVSNDTKFIYVKDMTKTELEVSVFTGNMNVDLGNYPVLYTTDKRDNKTIEVVVIVAEDIKIDVEDFIFVSADQIAGVSNTADGLSYEVYFADANEIVEILVDAAIEEAGFYEYTYDEEDNKYELTHTKADKFKDVLLKDKVINNIMGDYLVINNKTYDASAAIINDARGEDTIEDSIIPEITSFDELVAAFDVDGIEITISAILDEESDILNIYIIDINE